MRPSRYCPKFLPWIGTDRGEIDDVCFDEARRFTKPCDGCIDRPTDKETEAVKDAIMEQTLRSIADPNYDPDPEMTRYMQDRYGLPPCRLQSDPTEDRPHKAK